MNGKIEDKMETYTVETTMTGTPSPDRQVWSPRRTVGFLSSGTTGDPRVQRSRRSTRRAVRLVALAAVVCAAAGCSTDPTDSSPSAAKPTGTITPEPVSTASFPPNSLVYDDQHVQLRLARSASGPGVVSFGLPVPPGLLPAVDTVAVTVAGKPVAASVTVLLRDHDADGVPRGVRSVLVQFPASALTADLVDVAWRGGTPTPGTVVPFSATSVPSPAVALVADRTIKKVDGRATLVETGRRNITLFTGREPAVLVDFPPGYLATTQILGPQTPSSEIGTAGLAGMRFVSNAVGPFGRSAMYAEPYPLNPDSVVVPNTTENYEAWLYDRCATFLSFYIHSGDSQFLRYGYRACSSYASQIDLSGENRGIFTGKAEPDRKYSHLRGLYAYYALTGDESAMAAGEAIAWLWQNDEDFAVPYRQGHVRGPDKLWTERLLGTSMEGAYFGFLLTDRTEYLRSFRALLDTAYRHITGDAATLAAINPDTPAFLPQNCFVHTAEQHSEGDADEPWCSGWMSELLLPTLLAYQAQTDDPRVDEIFIRLTRFLRDVGSAYLTGDLLDDTFMRPSVRYDAADGESARTLVPLYGAGIDTDGKRQNYGEYDDFQHCPDATALVAAGLRGLRRTHTFDAYPVGPFASEGESFVALEEELAACAQAVLTDQRRPHRNPATWTADDLAEGLSDPAAFIADNKIGFSSSSNAPERRLSWWFNAGLLDFALLKDAGVRLDALHPGWVQP